MILAIWLALGDAIYSPVAQFYALNCIFFPGNETALLKHHNQSDFKAYLKGKQKTTFVTFYKLTNTGPYLYIFNKTCICAIKFFTSKYQKL